MKSRIPRYIPHRDFPPYAFIPGRNPHPEKEGGHMHGQEVEVRPLLEESFRENEAYLFGIDLFNHDYFWESHVWWEALWHLTGRKGKTADFLKGLIKLSAAGVKEELNQEAPALGHIQRCKEVWLPLANEEEIWFGLNLKMILRELENQSLKKCHKPLLKF